MHDDRRGIMVDGDEVILSTLYKRLEAFGKWKFGSEIYASQWYQDCLQKIVVWVWEQRFWEQLPSEEDVYRYSCKALVNCRLDAGRQAKRTDFLLEGELELMSAPPSVGSGPVDLQWKLELAAEVEWVKSLFQGDNTMLTYLEKLSLGKKRNEIASEMKLTPRQVTDLYRKLKRTVKRHLKGRG